MEPAALQRMSEMMKPLRLLLQTDTGQVQDLQLSLDADHVWREKEKRSTRPETTPLRASIFAESVVMV